MRSNRTLARPLALDLFCGAGGFSVGLERSGWAVAAGVDDWPAALETYRNNFSHPAQGLDLAEATAAEIREAAEIGEEPLDLVVGGPPCQGFSIQRIGADTDVRNDLVIRFAELVVGLRPRMFMMENVLGLVGSRGRRIVATFEHVLRSGGYEVEHTLANAVDFGVPQIRRRAFFYGWLESQVAPYEFPNPGPAAAGLTVMDAIGDLPSPPVDFQADPADPLHRRSRLSELNERRLRLIPPGGGFEDLPYELRVKAHRAGADKIGHRYVYGRLHPDKPASTITARFDSFTRGRFAHPVEHRNITLREGARLQTFPDSFQFSGTQEEIAAQIGNAVPPVQAAAIAFSMARHLSGPGEGTPQTRQLWLRELDVPQLASGG